MTFPTTTIQVYKADRDSLRNFARTPAQAVHRMLCEHPPGARGAAAQTTVDYPDGRRVPVTVFECAVCRSLVVLPGEQSHSRIVR